MIEVTRRNFLGLFAKGAVVMTGAAAFPKIAAGAVLGVVPKVAKVVGGFPITNGVSLDSGYDPPNCPTDETPLWMLKDGLRKAGRKLTDEVLKNNLGGTGLETLSDIASKFNRYCNYSPLLGQIQDAHNEKKWEEEQKKLEPQYLGEV